MLIDKSLQTAAAQIIPVLFFSLVVENNKLLEDECFCFQNLNLMYNEKYCYIDDLVYFISNVVLFFGNHILKLYVNSSIKE